MTLSECRLRFSRAGVGPGLSLNLVLWWGTLLAPGLLPQVPAEAFSDKGPQRPSPRSTARHPRVAPDRAPCTGLAGLRASGGGGGGVSEERVGSLRDP